MANIPSEPERFSPDDALPPVQPPDARFLVQLFLIPAALVIIIVMVWLAFSWLAQMGSDPYSYLDALERRNAVRWQAAYNLAEALRDPRHAELRRDPVLATRLVSILDHEVDSPGSDKEAGQLVGFLCSAVGKFQLPDLVLPTLLKLSETKSGPDPEMVRFAALRAVVTVVTETPDFSRAAHPEVLALAMRAADNDEPLIRSTSAFLLAGYGGDEAHGRLLALLSDSYPDVRYNAALVLARLGDDKAVPMLVEMLDPDQTAALAVEKEPKSREAKRVTVLSNALHAASELAAKNVRFDRTLLKAAVQRLRDREQNQSLALEAKDVLRQLETSIPAATNAS